jgi:hypothetical protein
MRRFWGSVVTSEAFVGVFWDRVVVGDELILLLPLARESRSIHSSDLKVVEFQKLWAPPFMVRTHVRFRRQSGDLVDKVFVPSSPKRFRQCLEGLGWPTVSVQFGE